MRSFNSPAAFSVKVKATMLDGFTPSLALSRRMATMRWEMTWVLPDPAQAMI